MATIHKYLGVPTDWKVVESLKHQIIILPIAQDIKTAKKGNPLLCALHNAACRQFGIPNCAVGSTYAYIPQRDAKGRPYIARVVSTMTTRRAIRTFDATGAIPEGGFVFNPVPISQRLKNQRHRWGLKDAAAMPKKPAIKHSPMHARPVRYLPING